MTAAPADLVLEDVTLGYDRHPALHHISATIPAGSLTAIVGPNGAGKSTLLKAIAGEMRPITGRIVNPAGRSGTAYMPQITEIDRTFPISVAEVVALGLWRRIGPFGRLGKAGRAAVAKAIARVGLTGLEKRPIATLSGGQMQRVLFARLALQDAALILLDEPFTGVDRRTIDDLLDVIDGWHQDGRTVLAVLHDLDEVRRRFPEAMLLARDLIAHGPSAAVLTSAHLTRARAVGEALDEAAPICKRAA
ncbi:zinc ABC transporter ATP-binding protein AztA [Acuticoccus sp. I52.16.1]|uniref:zinc ABC transporter ATP-binding protein AztA n=1 Tax=Acuticoccus sp. I52.16.1 TaxID=2928472 RepID=UPI001FD2971F|nr:zinc ABC transporter ATP-binding protein AztA [Acuticoccus sp. I52.16.1]UOM33237.1 ABC transporter ATP-binding protein [Acuticoccus sp. I52.16.1]